MSLITTQKTKTLVEENLVERLISLAPNKPYCSDNKTCSLIWPKDLAFKKCSYIQLNTVNIINWLIIDIDHQNPFIFEDISVAPPNIITINKENGHSQYFYAITGVCVSEKARIHPQSYLKSIRNAYRKALKGDVDFNSPVSKNPLSDEWQTYYYHDTEYSLGELADYIDIELEVVNFYAASNDEEHESRNCSLFNRVRHIAYKEVEKFRLNSDYNNYEAFILNVCEKFNQFHGKGFAINSNLNPNEVSHVAKSITKWTWERYFGGGKISKGVMSFKGLDITLKAKQRLSARRTHEEKEKKSRYKIQIAINKLQKSGEKLTQVRVAEVANLSRKTVNKFKKLIEDSKKTNKTLFKSLSKAKPKNVTFAVTSDNSAFKRSFFFNPFRPKPFEESKTNWYLLFKNVFTL